jgi:isopenicillin N synthase-like dioxygenase
MGVDDSEAPPCVPVIDLSCLSKGAKRASHEQHMVLISQLRAACHTQGCFYVANHGIAAQVCDDVLECSRRFFALPPSDKMVLNIEKSAGFRGFVAFGTQKTKGLPDLREALECGPEGAGGAEAKALAKARAAPVYDQMGNKAAAPAAAPLYECLQCPNQWPSEGADSSSKDAVSLKDAVSAFSAAASALCAGLLPLVAQSLGVHPAFFEQALGPAKAFATTQLSHYPAADSPEVAAHAPGGSFGGSGRAKQLCGRFGAGPHTGLGMLHVTLQVRDDSNYTLPTH